LKQLERQINFEIPLERVWSVWTDVENSLRWVSGVQESRITSEVRQGPGLVWQETIQLSGMPVPMKHTMTECRLHEKAVIDTELPLGGWMRRTLQFSSVAKSTKVLFKMEWDMGGAGLFLKPEEEEVLVQNSLEETLRNWKALAEKA